MDEAQQPEKEGEAVRVARMVKHVSQRALAQATGIESWKLIKFEHGLRPLTADERRRVWTALSGQ